MQLVDEFAWSTYNATDERKSKLPKATIAYHNQQHFFTLSKLFNEKLYAHSCSRIPRKIFFSPPNNIFQADFTPNLNSGPRIQPFEISRYQHRRIRMQEIPVYGHQRQLIHFLWTNIEHGVHHHSLQY